MEMSEEEKRILREKLKKAKKVDGYKVAENDTITSDENENTGKNRFLRTVVLTAIAGGVIGYLLANNMEAGAFLGGLMGLVVEIILVLVKKIKKS